MNLARLHKDLKTDEGVIYDVYLDPLGHKTFGIGHLVTQEDKEWDKPVGSAVSYERVHKVFEEDVAIAIKNCCRLYGEHFEGYPDEIQEVLVNMVFNLGEAGLSSFKRMNKAIDLGDYKEAAEEGRDSLWYRQVTNRAERLMKRIEEVGTT